MTPEQIIKGLEIHSDPYADCKECPYLYPERCEMQLCRDALALIRELTVENERLRAKGKEQIIGETADISRQLIETSITRALVAQEIFADIESKMEYYVSSQLDAYREIRASTFDELKKKYGVTDDDQ